MIFLNFGGISNIDYNGIGWDIGFCNMYFNYYAKKLGHQFDKNGQNSMKG